jgi:hypothetical protein
MKLPWSVPLALAVALALSVYSCQRAEREKGAIGVRLAASEAVGDSLRARRAIVDTWRRAGAGDDPAARHTDALSVRGRDRHGEVVR